MRRTVSIMDTNERSREQRNEDKGRATVGFDFCVLGICCGNGLNQLNFALVRYRQHSPNASLRAKLLKFGEIAVPHSIRNPLLISLRGPHNEPSHTTRINILLGRMFSRSIKFLCKRHDIDITRIDFVGTQAPTLRRSNSPPSEMADTDSLSQNTVMRLETGLTTVSEFSILKQTAVESPISPVAFVDTLLLRHPCKFRACLNINELANISFIPPYAHHDTWLTVSRDCGPGSLFIDYAMRYCTSNNHDEDHEGRYAAGGKVNQEIVDRFLESHDYLRASPPLIMAREMFGDHAAQRLIDECFYYNMSKADTVATITSTTARDIIKNYRKLLDISFPSGQKVDELFVCGFSAKNPHIIDYLEAELPECVITKLLDDIGIPGDANEAFCYAHLALETVLGQLTYTSNPNRQTRADAIVRGNVVPGENWEQLLIKVRDFSKGKPLYVTRNVEVTSDLEAGVTRLEMH